MCVTGYTGLNCTKKCPFPTYGKRCQNLCKCDKDQCDMSTGCSTLSDGILNCFFPCHRKGIFS